MSNMLVWFITRAVTCVLLFNGVIYLLPDTGRFLAAVIVLVVLFVCDWADSLA